jgi:hypothetical protein
VFASNPKQTTDMSRNFLLSAAMNGRVDECRRLVKEKGETDTFIKVGIGHKICFQLSVADRLCVVSVCVSAHPVMHVQCECDSGLKLASAEGHMNVVLFLIEECGADANAKDVGLLKSIFSSVHSKSNNKTCQQSLEE